MAELSEDVKRYIVQALACFDSPQQVAEAVSTEFGVEITRMQVSKYDPTKVSGTKVGKKWRDLFEATRSEWRKGATEVPIANRVFRLRALDRLAAKAERMRNMALAAQLLEQAAKEVGDIYVNRGRAAAGEDGGDMPTATQVIRSVKSARKDDGG